MSRFFHVILGCSSAALGCILGSLGDVLLRSSHLEEADHLCGGNVNEQETTASSSSSPSPKLLHSLHQAHCLARAEATRLLKLDNLRFTCTRLSIILQYPLTRPSTSCRPRLWKSETSWLIGVILLAVVQPLLLGTGLILAPALLVVAMSALALTSSMMAAIIFLNEILVMGALLGSSLIGVGLIGLVLAFWGDTDKSITPITYFHEARGSSKGRLYIGGTLILALITLSLTLTASRPYRLSSKIAVSTLAGLTSGVATVAAKIMLSLLATSTRTMETAEFWMTFWLTGGIALASIWSVNQSFRISEALLVVPVRNAANIAFGALGGWILLNEHASSTRVLMLSFGLVFGGVALIVVAQKPVVAGPGLSECRLEETSTTAEMT